MKAVTPCTAKDFCQHACDESTHQCCRARARAAPYALDAAARTGATAALAVFWGAATFCVPNSLPKGVEAAAQACEAAFFTGAGAAFAALLAARCGATTFCVPMMPVPADAALLAAFLAGAAILRVPSAGLEGACMQERRLTQEATIMHAAQRGSPLGCRTLAVPELLLFATVAAPMMPASASPPSTSRLGPPASPVVLRSDACQLVHNSHDHILRSPEAGLAAAGSACLAA